MFLSLWARVDSSHDSVLVDKANLNPDNHNGYRFMVRYGCEKKNSKMDD